MTEQRTSDKQLILLSYGELEDALNAMEMYGLQAAAPPDQRGPGTWEQWACTAEFAGRFARTVRAMLGEKNDRS